LVAAFPHLRSEMWGTPHVSDARLTDPGGRRYAGMRCIRAAHLNASIGEGYAHSAGGCASDGVCGRVGAQSFDLTAQPGAYADLSKAE